MFTAPDFAYTPLATRLKYYMDVGDGDVAALEGIAYEERHAVRGETIFARGQNIEWVVLIMSGWAARTRYTRDGARQIVNFLLPGDILTPDAFVIRQLEHEIEALSSVTLRILAMTDMQAVLERANGLASALWWAAAQEDSIVREHVVRLGRRNAQERIAHFLLEMHRRMLVVKQAAENSMILPLTQAEIADALGLSLVHVNRSLSFLQKEGHIDRRNTVIQLLDIPRLAEFCDFDTLYLSLERQQQAAV